MKKAIYAALALAPLFLLVSCGEDEPDPPDIDHEKIIADVNAHLDKVGIVVNANLTTGEVVTFNFKTADTAENRALLKVLAPNAPSDGRLIVRIKDDSDSEEAAPLELGNMKLSVASATSVAMNVQFVGTVTIDETGKPVGLVPHDEIAAETFAITYPLTEGELEIDGVKYKAAPPPAETP